MRLLHDYAVVEGNFKFSIYYGALLFLALICYYLLSQKSVFIGEFNGI